MTPALTTTPDTAAFLVAHPPDSLDTTLQSLRAPHTSRQPVHCRRRGRQCRLNIHDEQESGNTHKKAKIHASSRRKISTRSVNETSHSPWARLVGYRTTNMRGTAPQHFTVRDKSAYPALGTARRRTKRNKKEHNPRRGNCFTQAPPCTHVLSRLLEGAHKDKPRTAQAKAKRKMHVSYYEWEMPVRWTKTAHSFGSGGGQPVTLWREERGRAGQYLRPHARRYGRALSPKAVGLEKVGMVNQVAGTTPTQGHRLKAKGLSR